MRLAAPLFLSPLVVPLSSLQTGVVRWSCMTDQRGKFEFWPRAAPCGLTRRATERASERAGQQTTGSTTTHLATTRGWVPMAVEWIPRRRSGDATKYLPRTRSVVCVCIGARSVLVGGQPMVGRRRGFLRRVLAQSGTSSFGSLAG
ncbi:hypothetical protein BKA80DRAFT_279063 [Phyllosticta citrichinensis]